MRALPTTLRLAVAALATPLLLLATPADAAPSLTAVPYGAPGWRYLETTPGGGPAGFADPAFDDSSWAVGAAAFGSEGVCSGLDEVATPWSTNTDLLARKTFTLPAGATDLSVGIAIDNDYVVYVNGVQVGAGAATGCASYDDVVLEVEDTLLRTGSNTLAVRASDYGILAYFDATVTYTDGPAYQVCSAHPKGKVKTGHKAHKAGRTLPVKLRVCDSSGANVSSRDIVVHATTLETVDGSKTAAVKGAGGSNSTPPNDFRYRSARAGYIFNLKTKGLTEGTWQLAFTIDGEADESYVVEFRIRD